jgi:hypothetical protein
MIYFLKNNIYFYTIYTNYLWYVLPSQPLSLAIAIISIDDNIFLKNTSLLLLNKNLYYLTSQYIGWKKIYVLNQMIIKKNLNYFNTYEKYIFVWVEQEYLLFELYMCRMWTHGVGGFEITT